MNNFITQIEITPGQNVSQQGNSPDHKIGVYGKVSFQRMKNKSGF